MNTTDEREDRLKRIVHDYTDMVLRLALSQAGNLADAQDICQDVFVKVLRHPNKFRDHDHEKAWIVRVTLNRCKDLFRSPWKKWFRPYADVPEQFCPSDDEMEILPIVMTLSRKYRTVIHLYYYEGYSTAEIAGLLGIRDGTVRTQLRRARELLREKIGGYNDDDKIEVREGHEPDPGQRGTKAHSP